MLLTMKCKEPKTIIRMPTIAYDAAYCFAGNPIKPRNDRYKIYEIVSGGSEYSRRHYTPHTHPHTLVQ